jgi:hypothetical protein
MQHKNSFIPSHRKKSIIKSLNQHLSQMPIFHFLGSFITPPIDSKCSLIASELDLALPPECQAVDAWVASSLGSTRRYIIDDQALKVASKGQTIECLDDFECRNMEDHFSLLGIDIKVLKKVSGVTGF